MSPPDKSPCNSFRYSDRVPRFDSRSGVTESGELVFFVLIIRRLTTLQQAAVVSDPQNHVFVCVNTGFVAYAIEGTYNVLAIVDQTHLPTSVKDRITGVTLGSTHEIVMRSRTGSGDRDYVVALLYVLYLIFPTPFFQYVVV
jgi:hypothetical protein